MTGILKNVALVGGSGILGSKTLQEILKRGENNLTVITRSSSSNTYPTSVNVKAGEYTDSAFLEAALKGHDVLVIMLGFGGLPQQEGIIRAAAKAGLKYVLPTEYGAPSGNDKQAAASPVVQAKRDDHKLIESLGMKWVGVVTNGWIDYSLQYGVYDILIPERKATLYTDSARFSATTIPQVAAAVASFLCLPKSKIDESFANNYLYVSSFVLTQPEIFNSVLRVTGSTEKDWQIERKAVKNCIDEGWELVNGGNPAGHFKILYGLSYSDGMGGEISDLSHNQMLGLEQEDLDAVVKRAVEASRPGGFSAASTLAVPR